jgi:NADH-quinone oxidoreductase subunit J
MLQAVAFYLFAGILVFSALMVITARNPVYSVLFLILGFFNAAGLFIMLGAEFVGLILVIVYVGAVAVLFLFVVMMLDINFAELRKGAKQYVSVGLVLAALLLLEFFTVFANWKSAPGSASRLGAPDTSGLVNAKALGSLLYTNYVFAFQTSGLILLVAMIGAIVLTLHHKPDARRQKVGDQVARKRSEAMAVQKVATGAGISES